jgi:hypothetical protein
MKFLLKTEGLVVLVLNVNRYAHQDGLITERTRSHCLVVHIFLQHLPVGSNGSEPRILKLTVLSEPAPGKPPGLPCCEPPGHFLKTERLLIL